MLLIPFIAKHIPIKQWAFEDSYLFLDFRAGGKPVTL